MSQVENKPSKGRKKRKLRRKAPGFFSFVQIRQFLMILAAPGVATVIRNVHYPENESLMVYMVAAAVPSLLHGQLWQWSYSWYRKGADVIRNVRIGQVVLGVAHCAACGYFWYAYGTGAAGADIPAYYIGLTGAGTLSGLWETVRPLQELAKPPEGRSAAKSPSAFAAKGSSEDQGSEAQGSEEPPSEA